MLKHKIKKSFSILFYAVTIKNTKPFKKPLKFKYLNTYSQIQINNDMIFKLKFIKNNKKTLEHFKINVY